MNGNHGDKIDTIENHKGEGYYDKQERKSMDYNGPRKR